MGWKNLPAWLKDGIIGLVVGIFIYLFFILTSDMSDPLSSSWVHGYGIITVVGLSLLGMIVRKVSEIFPDREIKLKP